MLEKRCGQQKTGRPRPTPISISSKGSVEIAFQAPASPIPLPRPPPPHRLCMGWADPWGWACAHCPAFRRTRTGSIKGEPEFANGKGMDGGANLADFPLPQPRVVAHGAGQARAMLNIIFF